MYVTEALINLLIQFEGKSNKRYICPAGKPTIGIGHVILPSDRNLLRVTGKKSDAVKELTDEEIIDLKHLDMMDTINQLIELSPKIREFAIGEVDALASFVYNIGIGNFRTSTMWKQIKHAIAQEQVGNSDSANQFMTIAAEQFTQWVYIKKVMYKGLYRRRLIERAIFLNETEIDFKNHGYNEIFTNNEQARMQQMLKEYYADLKREFL